MEPRKDDIQKENVLSDSGLNIIWWGKFEDPYLVGGYEIWAAGFKFGGFALKNQGRNGEPKEIQKFRMDIQNADNPDQLAHHEILDHVEIISSHTHTHTHL